MNKIIKCDTLFMKRNSPFIKKDEEKKEVFPRITKLKCKEEDLVFVDKVEKFMNRRIKCDKLLNGKSQRMREKILLSLRVLFIDCFIDKFFMIIEMKERSAFLMNI